MGMIFFSKKKKITELSNGEMNHEYYGRGISMWNPNWDYSSGYK